MSDFEKNFPVLSAHIGIWDAEYFILDGMGHPIDRHRSRTEYRVEGDSYVQRTAYTWDDGRTTENTTTGTLKDGRLQFDTPVLKGEAREVSPSVVLVEFSYCQEPVTVVETLTRCDIERFSRTLQYFQNGRLVKAAIVPEERKVAD